jgi:hypothetical protein
MKCVAELGSGPQAEIVYEMMMVAKFVIAEPTCAHVAGDYVSDLLSAEIH